MTRDLTEKQYEAALRRRGFTRCYMALASYWHLPDPLSNVNVCDENFGDNRRHRLAGMIREYERHLHPQGYRGQCPCPQCGSSETGTMTVATSEKRIMFRCDCGHNFWVDADKVSSASKRLAELARAM